MGSCCATILERLCDESPLECPETPRARGTSRALPLNGKRWDGCRTDDARRAGEADAVAATHDARGRNQRSLTADAVGRAAAPSPGSTTGAAGGRSPPRGPPPPPSQGRRGRSVGGED